MNKKSLISGVAVASIALVAGTVIAASRIDVPVITRGTTGYTCASLHFGMNDSTLQGYVHVSSSGEIATGTYNYTGNNIIGVASGIAISQYKISNKSICYVENKGLKLSTGSKNSTVEFTLGSNIIGVTIYALGWYKSGAEPNTVSYLSVNSSSNVLIASSSEVSGTTDPTELSTYNAYYFALTETNKLSITATKQVIIGDIAFRVAA